MAGWQEALLYLGISLLLLFTIIGLFLLVASQTSLLHQFLRTKMLTSGSSFKTTSGPSDLSDPSLYGLSPSTRVLAIPVASSSTCSTSLTSSPTMAAWLMEPEDSKEDRKRMPLVLFLHGVLKTRGYHHRITLYKRLLAAGHPVLAIDYRGFADSSGTDVTETTLVEDATTALDYARETMGHGQVLVWGHSLGAAIAAHMMAVTDTAGMEKVALVLESPFNTMEGVIAATAKLYVRMAFRLVGIDKMDIKFGSTGWLPKVPCPVLIAHAKEDTNCPVSLSEELFVETKRSKEDVSRVLFDGFGFGHSNLPRYEGLAKLVADFWEGRTEVGNSIIITKK